MAAAAAAAAAAPQGCMDGGEKKIEKNGTFSTLRRFGLFRAFSAVFGRFRPFSGVFGRVNNEPS